MVYSEISKETTTPREEQERKYFTHVSLIVWWSFCGRWSQRNWWIFIIIIVSSTENFLFIVLFDILFDSSATLDDVRCVLVPVDDEDLLSLRPSSLSKVPPPPPPPPSPPPPSPPPPNGVSPRTEGRRRGASFSWTWNLARTGLWSDVVDEGTLSNNVHLIRRFDLSVLLVYKIRSQ